MMDSAIEDALDREKWAEARALIRAALRKTPDDHWLLVFALALAGCYPEERIDIAPDGKTALLSVGGKGVYRVHVEDGRSEEICKTGYNAVLSPDGKRFVMQTRDGDTVKLVLHDSGSKTSKALYSHQDEKNKNYIIVPSWRPDGKQVAFVRFSTHSEGRFRSELHVIDLDSGADHKVAEQVGMHCAWSPGGDKLAYYRAELPEENRLCEPTFGSLSIYGEQKSEDVCHVILDFSADVTWLAEDRVLFMSPLITFPCRSPRKIPVGVFAYDLATKGIAQILQSDKLNLGGYYSPIRLAPDGKRFLFGLYDEHEKGAPNLREQEPMGRISLWCYDFDAAESFMLVESVSAACPAWAGPDKVWYFESPAKLALLEINGSQSVVKTRALDLALIFEGERN